MLVKAKQKGFYLKIREVGSPPFEFDGDKCPEWCVEIKEKKVTEDGADDTGLGDAKSKDSTATDAIRLIGTLNTTDEVKAFLDDDTRVTVKDAAEERIDKIRLGEAK